ncbi:MAG TPA: alpha/beta fold hydrolase [Nocardioidaceae bacterium]|nr:alpha/beta fold hydrolase [Nocardioidaceae bacterium]
MAVVLITALVGAALVTTPAHAASHATAAAASADSSKGVVAPIPTLSWHPCFGGDLQCTRADVPLDYDDPTGETTSIFMSMQPATDPAHRIGTLFVNPGGPGGPSSQVVQYFAGLFGPKVAQRFDIVGIDPRGIGRSTQVRCRSSQPMPRFPRNWVPLNLAQAKPLIRFNSWIADACAEESNAILDHMTTADTARDMDLIRQAVGDPKLSYYGISYGTYLGATYAAMFPDDVRAVILDGVLDPVAWSTGRGGLGEVFPFSTRLRSGVGAWDALVSAFNECDRVGAARCRLAGSAADKWRRIVNRLKQGPVPVDNGKIYYSDVIGGTLGALYSRDSYRFLMREIAALYQVLFGPDRTGADKRGLIASFRRMADSRPWPYANSIRLGSMHGAKARPANPPFEGVACSDSVNPTDPTAWVHAGAVADRQGPWFGRVWTWASGPCATWPASKDDAYMGPWRTTTSAPLMIVGNFHDPATPISGARIANTLFEGSHLLSLNTWGHGAIGQSACVTVRMQRYLVHGVLPPSGMVCQPDKQLFPIKH